MFIYIWEIENKIRISVGMSKKEQWSTEKKKVVVCMYNLFGNLLGVYKMSHEKTTVKEPDTERMWIYKHDLGTYSSRIYIYIYIHILELRRRSLS